jgi:peptide chain release factor 1
MRDKLQQILTTFDDLTARLGDPAVLGDQKEYARLAKEQRAQQQLAEKAREYLSAAAQLDEAKEVLRTESDQDMKEFAAEEIKHL